MLVLFTPSPWAWLVGAMCQKYSYVSDRFGPVSKKEQNDNGDTAPRKWVGLTQNWHTHAAGWQVSNFPCPISLSLSLSFFLAFLPASTLQELLWLPPINIYCILCIITLRIVCLLLSSQSRKSSIYIQQLAILPSAVAWCRLQNRPSQPQNCLAQQSNQKCKRNAVCK